MDVFAVKIGGFEASADRAGSSYVLARSSDGRLALIAEEDDAAALAGVIARFPDGERYCDDALAAAGAAAGFAVRPLDEQARIDRIGACLWTSGGGMYLAQLDLTALALLAAGAMSYWRAPLARPSGAFRFALQGRVGAEPLGVGGTGRWRFLGGDDDGIHLELAGKHISLTFPAQPAYAADIFREQFGAAVVPSLRYEMAKLTEMKQLSRVGLVAIVATVKGLTGLLATPGFPFEVRELASTLTYDDVDVVAEIGLDDRPMTSRGLRFELAPLVARAQAAGPVRLAVSDGGHVDIVLDGGPLRVEAQGAAPPEAAPEMLGLAFTWLSCTVIGLAIEPFVHFLDVATRLASLRRRDTSGVVRIVARGVAAEGFEALPFVIHYILGEAGIVMNAFREDHFASYADALRSATMSNDEARAQIDAVPMFKLTYDEIAADDPIRPALDALGVDLVPYARARGQGRDMPLESQTLGLVTAFAAGLVQLCEHGEERAAKVTRGNVELELTPLAMPWVRLA